MQPVGSTFPGAQVLTPNACPAARAGPPGGRPASCNLLPPSYGDLDSLPTLPTLHSSIRVTWPRVPAVIYRCQPYRIVSVSHPGVVLRMSHGSHPCGLSSHPIPGRFTRTPSLVVANPHGPTPCPFHSIHAALLLFKLLVFTPLYPRRGAGTAGGCPHGGGRAAAARARDRGGGGRGRAAAQVALRWVNLRAWSTIIVQSASGGCFFMTCSMCVCQLLTGSLQAAAGVPARW